MIQELLSGATLIAAAGGGERNSSYSSSSSINAGLGGGASQSPSSTTTVTTTTSTPTTATTTAENQNLRCPRCDSSNTKFCYYNNYNLTQPRHFCKTCRRYWTKGGALRNVPIGGGSRKNKNFGMSSSSSAASKTTATKLKTVASEFINGNPGSLISHGFEVEHVLPPPSQILWGSPQSSHLLSLLRSNQNQNQSPNPNLVVGAIKEGNLMGSHSHHMVSTEPMLHHRTPSSYDVGVGHVLCNSFGRNNQDQPQQINGAFLLGEQQQQHQNSGIQELIYQKLRSGNNNNNNYRSDSGSQVFMGNNVASSTSNILEPTTSVAGGGQLGYWNNPTTLSSWSDLPTTNGAYP